MMQRCLQLAKLGLGSTYPNPLVGSVIVHDGHIIGEGWHQKAGEPHAEINAINAVRQPELLRASTLYVNLEPCSHFGKTPPCAHTIVALGIPKVVIGCRDYASHVNGRGIAYLRDHGVMVVEGVLEKESQWLNRRFFTFQKKRRPFVILKFAQTANGYFAPQKRIQKWITNAYSKQIVHKWRTEEQAILVGKNTALIDKPQLSARLWHGESPLRVLVAKNWSPELLPFLSTELPTMVFNAERDDKEGAITYRRIDFEKNVLQQVLSELYKLNIQSMIVEGGAITINHFIRQNLWDEARVLVGPEAWSDGINAPQLPHAKLVNSYQVGEDTHYIYNNEWI